MKVTVEAADSEALSRSWGDLLARTVNPAPYRSQAWIETWLGMAKARCRMLAVRGEMEGRTVAFGILGVGRERLTSGLAARLFEANDPALDDIYVEYNDVLLTARAPQDARRRMLDAVLTQGGAPTIVLRNAVPALRQAALAAGRDRAWVVRIASELPCYGAPLDAPPPMSRNTRQQVARSIRLYEADGLSVEVADAPETRASALSDLVVLHEAVWRARGQTGAFKPDVLAFHRTLVARADAPVEIMRVRSGGKMIGMLYNLIGERTVHNYQSGFAASDDNRRKPGLTTHVLAMRHYAGRGFTAYDMMAGQSRYKESLSEPHRRLSTVVLEKPTVRQRLRGVARNVRR